MCCRGLRRLQCQLQRSCLVLEVADLPLDGARALDGLNQRVARLVQVCQEPVALADSLILLGVLQRDAGREKKKWTKTREPRRRWTGRRPLKQRAASPWRRSRRPP